MIDKVNGSISFDHENVVLKPNMSIDSFKKTSLYHGGNFEPNYPLKDIKSIGNKEFHITVYFNNDKLKEVHLYEANEKNSWGEWSEESELKTKKNHDDWLMSILGSPPYEYPWGQVGSVFDRKALISSIMVIFN
ncbi:hypothetical protein P4631_00415 [Halalkalibacterium halodurans]|uniref:hypothetical protein n=1 Tax=Halalkalibacterium halodurans TaxID=86665 RepID=UPI002E1EC65D|nr:hypothetical protein [Halalkalibacterium halodurans]MED4170912.1 hypothetical protein [Halalkalibacterium halodurans]